MQSLNTVFSPSLSIIIMNSWYKRVSTQQVTADLPHRDTAGQERFRTLTNAYYRGAQVCMYGIYMKQSVRKTCYKSIKNGLP